MPTTYKTLPGTSAIVTVSEGSASLAANFVAGQGGSITIKTVKSKELSFSAANTYLQGVVVDCNVSATNLYVAGATLNGDVTAKNLNVGGTIPSSEVGQVKIISGDLTI